MGVLGLDHGVRTQTKRSRPWTMAPQGLEKCSIGPAGQENLAKGPAGPEKMENVPRRARKSEKCAPQGPKK